MTLIREDVLQSWSKAHPDWPHSIGAVGPANEGTDPDLNVSAHPALTVQSPSDAESANARKASGHVR